MTIDAKFGHPPVIHSTSVDLPTDRAHVSFQFGRASLDERARLFLLMEGAPFSVNDHHRTVVVELDFETIEQARDIKIRVERSMYGSSSANLEVTLAGTYIHARPSRSTDGGRPNVSTQDSQSSEIVVSVSPTDTCVTVAFHAMAHVTGHPNQVFVEDPLVILVPKKTNGILP